ncbi:hypothetical protein EIN_055360 [Entamoeba invadens IP1]|uniref:hypothetical protein n=1 Tax=Entamoeba invadens IP1 TaxID=370355 RepID=UPI0002C3E78D|nr:hypothetical protein EIN_055360 [Entamoeba invadens IP1]ELP93221.1 hypothetical protein EIN_055360 [Entamoeba invadens IP1]|eukprot:XP_004259992.1 hypothetical protein EIN_055360 [Entamoeba invadens IP1]
MSFNLLVKPYKSLKSTKGGFANARTLQFYSRRPAIRKVFFSCIERQLMGSLSEEDNRTTQTLMASCFKIFFNCVDKKLVWKARFLVKKYGTLENMIQLKRCYLLSLRKLLSDGCPPKYLDILMEYIFFLCSFDGSSLVQNQKEFNAVFNSNMYLPSLIGYYLKNNMPNEAVQVHYLATDKNNTMSSDVVCGYMAIGFLQIFEKTQNQKNLEEAIRWFSRSVKASTLSCYVLNKFIKFLTENDMKKVALNLVEKALRRQSNNIFAYQLKLEILNKKKEKREYQKTRVAYALTFPYSEDAKVLVRRKKTKVNDAVKILLNQIEFPTSPDEHYKQWILLFKIVASNPQLIQTNKTFSNPLWKARHFPQNIESLALMEKRLIDLKKRFYAILY